MIDIIEAEKAFKEYVKPYDVTNGKISLKIRHTFRVVEVAKKISQELNLTEEQILLAELIGLLHDIGRFEQVKKYNTFSDKNSIDHAKLGIKILFEDGMIRKFIKETTYDDIIYKAIINHNKFKIEEGLKEEELLQAKLIRDADKTDIFAVFVEDIQEKRNVLYNYSEVAKQSITPIVMQKFEQYEQANRDEFEKEIDDYINIIGFIFDYNFIPGLKIIKENKYIEKIMKPISNYKPTEKQMKKIIEISNKYIDARIEKGC